MSGNCIKCTHCDACSVYAIFQRLELQRRTDMRNCPSVLPATPTAPPGVIAFDFLVTFDGVYVLGGGAINKLPSNWFYFFHFCLGSFDFARHRAKSSKHTHLRHPEWRSQICENYRSISRHKREKRWNIKTIAKPLQSHIIQMPEINQT